MLFDYMPHLCLHYEYQYNGRGLALDFVFQIRFLGTFPDFNLKEISKLRNRLEFSGESTDWIN